jgi:hypothetical protein
MTVRRWLRIAATWPPTAPFAKDNNMNARLTFAGRRIFQVAALTLAAGAGLAASTAALAQHHHGWGPRVGIYVGPGYPYYYPPSYYYPPPVVMQAQPPVYIEQAPQQVAPAPSAAPQAQAPAYYFCAAANGYYPYVKECPGGWQQVAPQPAR